MLSPETLATLEQALNAVIEEAGDDPQLEELVAQLEQARDAIPAGDEGPPAGEAPAGEAPDDEEERDPFSFEDAEKEWGRRKKAAKKKPPAEEADAEDEDV